jgi:hypothetical protein
MHGFHFRETAGVANYQVKTAVEDGKLVFKIRDDWSFPDMPSLLSFYKRNLFKTTSLVKPVSGVTPRPHSTPVRPYCSRKRFRILFSYVLYCIFNLT